jgi:hypothetical protein
MWERVIGCDRRPRSRLISLTLRGLRLPFPGLV